ncbi:MAG: hypothetical protein K2J67_04640, partial [Lachnospiraceae bacterium]|nr:hypothetical protein [Lachnospiraceae bacterium]
MNQYQRMVSYLYEYKQGVKGVNVGYVRIEQRGSGCRISLQMRSRNLGQLSDVAVFRQGAAGIRSYTIGTLTERNGDYRCRIETDAGNLMESGIAISDVDGIILYQDDTYYVATTWKNQGVRVGENRIWDPAEPEDTTEPDPVEPESIESEEMASSGQIALEQSDMDGSLPLPGESGDRKDGQEDDGRKEVSRGMVRLSGENGNQKNIPMLMGADEEHKNAPHFMGSDRDSNDGQPFRNGGRERPFMGEDGDRNRERSFVGEDGDRNRDRTIYRESRDRKR